jgi:hypothetical protein
VIEPAGGYGMAFFWSMIAEGIERCEGSLADEDHPYGRVTL